MSRKGAISWILFALAAVPLLAAARTQGAVGQLPVQLLGFMSGSAGALLTVKLARVLHRAASSAVGMLGCAVALSATGSSTTEAFVISALFVVGAVGFLALVRERPGRRIE